MKSCLKVAAAALAGAMLLFASCNSALEIADYASAQARASYSGSNGSIDVSGSNGSLTVSYSSGQVNSVKLYVSEGNGYGLVLANQNMNYSNGVYSYTFSNGTFTSGATIRICVLVNNGGEYCVPQGNLADSGSWTAITYGSGSTSSSSSSSSSASTSDDAYYFGDGTYFFIAKCSDKSLDNDGWSTTHGTNIQQWTYGGDQANQRWILKSAGNGYYYIINQHSGFALDGDNWGTTSGTNIIQWDLGNGQANQMWKFVIQGDSSFKVVNKHSGLVMDVSGSSKDNGANVQLWSWNGSDAQKWWITWISSSTEYGTGRSSSSSSSSSGSTSGSSVGSGRSEFAGSGANNSLVWSDEFEGNSVNMENWSFQTGNGGWGNNEMQYYTNGNNVSVGNGVLTITADSNLNSTRMNTMSKKYFRYGKVVARIKMDQGTGSWPAFWMLGQNMANGVGWPWCGEIDIMEHANNDAYIFNTCHWNGSGSSTSSGYNHSYWGQTTNNNYWNSIGSLNVSDWHEYSIDWNSSYIGFYVDGVQTMGMDIGNASNGTDAFNNYFYILLNFAMGGDFTGIYNRGSFNNIPWHMYVDYVRVYQ